MTDLPPDVAVFASLLDAQPEPARAAFAYCLAVAMVQDGEAQEEKPMERDKIFLVGRDRGELIPMEATDYTSEDELQAYLARYPDLLAGHQINPDAPRRWLLVAREMGVPGLPVTVPWPACCGIPASCNRCPLPGFHRGQGTSTAS